MQVVHVEYLVDHDWIVTCDHYLDDRLSLYHVSDDAIANHVQHFSRAASPSLIVCLYLACSKILKLTAASNAGGARRISGRSRLDRHV